MRLFVAVRPPEGAVGGVADPHVTLCFLGDVEDVRVAEVEAALRSALAGRMPCDAVVAGPPRRLGPSALVRAVGGLEDLAAAVRAAVGGFAARPDERAFHGHLTVARRRRGVAAPSSEVRLDELRWRVEEVVLVRSELGRGPGGTAHHEVVARIPLPEGS